MPFRFFLSLALLTLVIGCTKKPVDLSVLSADQLAERGKFIYTNNCTSCHNVDAKVDGSAGPSIHGTSLEVLTAKLLKADYPSGYKPKRDTRIMPVHPQLEKEIPAIHAYLSNVKP